MEKCSYKLLYTGEKLPRSVLLKSRVDIKTLLGKGKRFKSGSVTITLYRVSKESNFKVAFLVSKKLGKKAWLRNRVKRWLRELFRKSKSSFPRGYHIAVSVRRPYVGLRYNDLKKDYNELITGEEFTDFFD